MKIVQIVFFLLLVLTFYQNLYFKKSLKEEKHGIQLMAMAETSEKTIFLFFSRFAQKHWSIRRIKKKLNMRGHTESQR